ncbi:LutC/YkgG family protein [Pseudodesulfovibrio indicus]|jgi:L-lactate dehydrogenase complex protein LldG|uniref:L-lactate dehydrogenase complex protein LldG n=1 Tax=Pseudodesulfovibrio indicus TaxID=1716143 RepID=A0A126QMG0_9BACT|nr:lactate utilization protein [Pseudodesulfovibrio indicus]AMK11270.1 lactate utilization protein B/C [Pseudodesulfovibrio indicus]TDT85583.1 L-lactate dehydrogenase complex protein LldG [Pseudodesulfovibrio indicus]
MASKEDLYQQFVEKAQLVSAKVSSIANEDDALEYVINLCGEKEACQLLASGCEADLSDKAEALCDAKQKKVIAAPGLKADLYKKLSAQAKKAGFDCIESGMRDHLAGIDIGFTFAEYGIADTGTLMLDCPGEELRLATMVSEFHVCVLPKSKIKANSYAVEKMMLTRMKKTPDYLAFITGASRTADIERVLALGVHGPLELHILILED